MIVMHFTRSLAACVLLTVWLLPLAMPATVAGVDAKSTLSKVAALPL